MAMVMSYHQLYRVITFPEVSDQTKTAGYCQGVLPASAHQTLFWMHSEGLDVR